jgi:cytidine deaminase
MEPSSIDSPSRRLYIHQTPPTTMNHSSLIALARKARKNSYAPYSKFRVGAALLAADGRVYTGVNIEIDSLGLTMCAERTALFKAVSEGDRKFTAIAIAGDPGRPTPPCGACRQALHSLAGDLTVVLAGPGGRTVVHQLSDLLPHPFVLTSRRRQK